LTTPSPFSFSVHVKVPISYRTVTVADDFNQLKDDDDIVELLHLQVPPVCQVVFMFLR